MWSIFLQIIAGVAGLFLADKYVKGVDFTRPLFLFPRNQEQIHAFFGTLTFVGAFLGILNGIVKPIINKIAFPLRIITLNLFSLVVAMAMVWITDVIFPELVISGISAYFWTTVIIWGLGFILLKWLPSKNK
jgi:putative membrane protein